jgi:hypothetical protein
MILKRTSWFYIIELLSREVSIYTQLREKRTDILSGHVGIEFLADPFMNKEN